MERVERIAREAGAADVRVAPALVDRSSQERMRDAFARGDFATWPYDDRYAATAADPAAVLPGARSVICIAMPYATPGVTRAPLTGRVSNYAWSEDYHRRMRRLLDRISRTIDDAAGERVTAVACDTKPLAERAFAARSGLGWIGKHTNLISRTAGSFVFLGEVITTLDLAAQPPLRKTCGSCVRCVEACPTRALRGDYTIDANRCIADLTQRTDAIPREMRALVGDWIWGCDICQIVCPPTRNAGHQGGRAFSPFDAATGAPALVALLQLRSGEYRRRYRHTAMGWRGAAVLRRNAAVALGNSLDRSTVSALASSLEHDPHPMVRGHAAWALGKIGSPAAIAALRSRAVAEPQDEVADEIGFALEPFS